MHLCLGRIGLHADFLNLCLRRTCETDFNLKKKVISSHDKAVSLLVRVSV